MESSLILLNLLVCGAGLYVVVCRQGLMSGSDIKPVVHAQHAILFALFFMSALSWLFGEPANWIQIIWAAGMIAHLSLGYGAWKNGAPSYTYRGNRDPVSGA